MIQMNSIMRKMHLKTKDCNLAAVYFLVQYSWDLPALAAFLIVEKIIPNVCGRETDSKKSHEELGN